MQAPVPPCGEPFRACYLGWCWQWEANPQSLQAGLRNLGRALRAARCQTVVPLARLERARLSTNDFESFASTIPPQGHPVVRHQAQTEPPFSRPSIRPQSPYAGVNAEHHSRPALGYRR